MRSNIFLTVILFLPSLLIAQELKDLAFEETTYDFGTVEEQNGPVTHEFVFTNTGIEPIKILNVKASCGCTTPGWSKEEIKPGEKGFVKARYNPLNRPGPFHKSLTITTTGQTKTHVVFIKGNVQPKPKSIEDEYPNKLGALRVKYKTFNFGRITTKEPVQKEFGVYNESDQVITFKDNSEAPGYIKVGFYPESLQPKQKGKILVTYDAKAKNDYGFVNDNIAIFTNEESGARKEFRVFATIEEYFPPMTPELLARSPRLEINEHTHDFGRIEKGTEVKAEFQLTNTGKSELNIRKTKATCGCTVSKLDKKDLKPGESIPLEVTFNSTGKRGSQQKSISIFSNDPVDPVQRLTIKAYVKE